MLEKKESALRAHPVPEGISVCLTNCPSCISGLGRLKGIGLRAEHLAVALARSVGGAHWEEELGRLATHHELVNV
jgi:Fe-S oxidoreductase